MRVTELETPALVLDLDAFERNIRIMSSCLEGTGARLRPHFKTNKCVSVAKAQLAAGAKGITCAKLGEAEVLAEAGVQDILIANQIVQPSKLLRLAELAKKSRITVCADHEKQIDLLEEAAARVGSTVHVYVELEVGMKRCGVAGFEEYHALARKVTEAPHLVYGGIQAYAGYLSHEADETYRVEAIRSVEQRLSGCRDYLERRGIPVAEISGGSTATAKWKARGGVYTELQAGSYVFLDAAYDVCGLEFGHSLRVLTTVISRTDLAAVVDAGVKNFSIDQVPPIAPDLPCDRVAFSEEHTAFYNPQRKLEIGDQVAFYPGHCCTTVNTFDFLYVARGDEVLGRWAIEGRGKSV